MNDLSPDDIESIDILKGATASSLYGVRGRAGAIMITTKKGRGKGLLINISNNTMISAGYLKIPKKQSSYSAGNYGELEYNSGYVWGDYMDGHEVEQYDPITMSFKKMPLLPRGKNNLKNFIRPSLSTNTNINVSQSGEFGSFRVSATQIHQNGQYPNTKLDKYIVNGGGNITYKKFKLDANLSYKKEMSPNLPRVDYGGGNIFYNLLIWTGNEFDVRDFKNYWKVKDQVQNWPYTAWYDNPYYIVYERINKNDQDLFNTNIYMSYDILKNLFRFDVLSIYPEDYLPLDLRYSPRDKDIIKAFKKTQLKDFYRNPRLGLFDFDIERLITEGILDKERYIYVFDGKPFKFQVSRRDNS